VENGELDLSLANLVYIGRTNLNQATLTVAGGTLNSSQFKIGYFKGLGTLIITNNAVVKATSFTYLGASPNSIANGGTGVVWVASGQLILTNDVLEIGYQGTGQMTVSGGSVTSAHLSLGNLVGTSGTLNVSGGQFMHQPRTTNDLTIVGFAGSGQMNVSGGSVTINSEFILGDEQFNGTGYDLGTGIVFVTGGQLSAVKGLTSIGKYGIGAMTISNGTVTLTNLSVARHDNSSGTLNILTNGILYCFDALSIGRFHEGTGTAADGKVIVDGGLLSLTNEVIWVGRGGTGSLLVSNGTVKARSIYVAMSSTDIDAATSAIVTNRPAGTMTMAGGNILLSSNLVIGTSLLSTGQVAMVGGTLALTNNSGSANLNISSGSFTLNQGLLAVDDLEVTNQNGTFTFNGGMLEAGKINAANGVSFVVGNGVDPATLKLKGGIYNFVDGLVISSNATVTGCGTIIGNIINQGTLDTNCLTVVIVMSNFTFQPTNKAVFFTTVSGWPYSLQYCTNLSGLNWITIPPSVLGTGSIMSLVDTNPTVPQRFYRITSP
jgi:hypothetical protein